MKEDNSEEIKIKANLFDIFIKHQENLSVLEDKINDHEIKSYYDDYRETVNRFIELSKYLLDACSKLDNCGNNLKDIIKTDKDEEITKGNEELDGNDDKVDSDIVEEENTTQESIDDTSSLDEEPSLSIEENTTQESIDDTSSLGGMFGDPSLSVEENTTQESIDDTSSLGGMFGDPSENAMDNTDNNNNDNISSQAVINIPKVIDDSTEIELPSIDASNVVENSNNNSNSKIYQSESDGRALIVSNGQASKLRGSRDIQEELLKTIDVNTNANIDANTNDNDNVNVNANQGLSPEQQEELTEKMISLYKQGEIEKAEEISKILTKK